MLQPPPPPFLERSRQKIRLKHYSLRTEQAYLDWIKRFILFHGKRHPVEMGAPEVESFLTHLAVDRGVSASTQNQAKSALLFMYKEVLGTQLPWLDHVERAKTPQRMPVVLPDRVAASLKEQLGKAHALHQCDLAVNGGAVFLPDALALKYPRVARERRPRRTRCGIRLPRICWTRATTSARCRNCWAIRTSAPR